MKYLIASCFVALCGLAGGQTSAPVTTSGQLWLANSSINQPILTCTMKDDGRVDKCTLAEGHTLEEAMQAMMDSTKLSSDAYNAEIKDADKRLTSCIGIAERENKALRRCSDGLNSIAKMLRKDAKK